jgi:hypothetical protein
MDDLEPSLSGVAFLALYPSGSIVIRSGMFSELGLVALIGAQKQSYTIMDFRDHDGETPRVKIRRASAAETVGEDDVVVSFVQGCGIYPGLNFRAQLFRCIVKTEGEEREVADVRRECDRP